MKTITVELPDNVIAGSITVVCMTDRVFGLELKTRNFDFQVKDGTAVTFEDDEST